MPGHWFLITDRHDGHWTNWQCIQCKEGGCTGNGEYGLKNDRCPTCGWEGKKSDLGAFFEAEAQFKKIQQCEHKG